MYHGTIANGVPLLLHGTPSYHSAVRLGPHTDWYRPCHNSLGGSGERCECHSVKGHEPKCYLGVRVQSEWYLGVRVQPEWYLRVGIPPERSSEVG